MYYAYVVIVLRLKLYDSFNKLIGDEVARNIKKMPVKNCQLDHSIN